MGLDKNRNLSAKQLLIAIANGLLLTDFDKRLFTNSDSKSLVERIQIEFQNELRAFYLKSEYSKKIKELKSSDSKLPLDEQALQVLARLSDGIENTPQIARQLPKFSKNYKDPGYECTLSTAMMRFALEQLGYKNARSVLLKRHHLAVRELPDGSMKFYDAANRTTRNGELFGFTHTFDPNEIIDKKEIGENNYTFVVRTKSKIEGSELFSDCDQNSYYVKKFLAYDPSILIHLTVVLENLSEFKNQKDKYSVKLCESYPILNDLYFKELKNKLGLFDGYDYL